MGVGAEAPITGVTCDLRCPFSNSDELFQPKVMCENLIRIGWVFQELSFEFSRGEGGGGQKPLLGGLHMTCDAHFRSWLSYSSQKSYMEIWFRLTEPFKSYRVHKPFCRGGGKNPLLGRLHWPVMPIFELGWAIPAKSHVRKFGLDRSRLSRESR